MQEKDGTIILNTSGPKDAKEKAKDVEKTNEQVHQLISKITAKEINKQRAGFYEGKLFVLNDKLFKVKKIKAKEIVLRLVTETNTQFSPTLDLS